MRKNLKSIGNNKSIRVIGKFIKRTNKGLLINNVALLEKSNNGKVRISKLLTEHVTLVKYYGNHEILMLHAGDLIICTCRIKKYTRLDSSTDYGLEGFRDYGLKDIKIIKPVICNSKLYFIFKTAVNYRYEHNKDTRVIKYKYWALSNIEDASRLIKFNSNIKIFNNILDIENLK